MSKSAWLEDMVFQLHDAGIHDPLAIAMRVLAELDGDELRAFALIGIDEKIRSIDRRKQPSPQTGSS